jgi:hypothetical protein
LGTPNSPSSRPPPSGIGILSNTFFKSGSKLRMRFEMNFSFIATLTPPSSSQKIIGNRKQRTNTV